MLFPFSLITYFLGKNSVNPNVVNPNDQNSITENSSNNLNSSSFTTESNQNLSDNQNISNSLTPNKSEINEPKFIEIEVNTMIYKDKELSQVLIESTQTKVKAQIIEEGDNWLKIMRTVYAHKSTSTTQNCTDKEIILTQNIRIEPDKNAQLFGTLKQPSQFKNLDSNSQLEWCKFQFEVYIKK